MTPPRIVIQFAAIADGIVKICCAIVRNWTVNHGESGLEHN